MMRNLKMIVHKILNLNKKIFNYKYQMENQWNFKLKNIKINITINNGKSS